MGKEKKKKKFRWWYILIALLIVGAIGSAGNKSDDSVAQESEPQESAVVMEESTPTTEPSEEPTPTATPEPTQTPEPVEISEVEGKTKANTFVLDISQFSDSDLGEIDTGDLELYTGELLYVNYCGDGVFIVKAKIQSQLTNKMTIGQNYYTVCNLIKKHGFDSCEELQYWSIIDTRSGDEVKAISFTLDKSTINAVADGVIIENQLGNYVQDLFILPALQD